LGHAGTEFWFVYHQEGMSLHLRTGYRNPGYGREERNGYPEFLRVRGLDRLIIHNVFDFIFCSGTSSLLQSPKLFHVFSTSLPGLKFLEQKLGED